MAGHPLENAPAPGNPAAGQLSATMLWFARALALHQAGRLDEAQKIYTAILAADPDHFDSLHLLGVALHQRGEHAEALRLIDRALQQNPDDPFALSNRGTVLHALGRFAEALESYDRALRIHPDYADAICNRAAALHELKRYEEALASCDLTIAREPGYPEAHCSRGNTLKELKRYEEALASCDRALALRPDYAEAHCNRGNALYELDRFAEAIASYDRALALRPDYAEVHTNRGVALHDLKRFDAALASYERAIAVAPHYAEAHYRVAMCRLLIGDFKRGWEEQEWRWRSRQLEDTGRSFSQPLWTGTGSLAGKTVLIHAEQGFGDTIQFCRYLPLVAQQAARVVVEVPRPLCDLIGTVTGNLAIVAQGDPLPAFDVHTPMLSMPLAFGAEPDSIPSAMPYLHASAPAAEAWRRRLGNPDRAKIGLAWAGNPRHKNDRRRSLGLEALLAALDGVDATLVSLQCDLGAGDGALLRSRPDVLHFGGELATFADTAALIANLDLVIAVDTAVAHLAGALARPAWVMLPFIPDWRWLLDRDDSPWYPTMRLFRQDDTRTWDSVMVRLRAALDAHLAQVAGQSRAIGETAR